MFTYYAIGDVIAVEFHASSLVLGLVLGMALVGMVWGTVAWVRRDRGRWIGPPWRRRLAPR